MSPPKNRRGPASSPEKSPLAKRLKASDRSANTEVKGQPAAHVNKPDPKAKRMLLADIHPEPDESPPQWFLTFFVDFERRLDERLESLLVKRLDELTVKGRPAGREDEIY